MSTHNPELQAPTPPDPKEAIQPDAPDFVETPDIPEATTERQSLPVWLYLVCGFFLFMAGSSFAGFGTFGQGLFDQGVGGASLTSASNAPVIAETPLSMGKKVYTGNCQSCHQGSGEGQPGKYPPMAGSEWVLGSKERLAAILINGLSGPVTVKGASYGTDQMAAWKGTLNDKQIANVLTYIRQTWGNTANDVTEEEVNATRKKVSSLPTAYCEADLLKIAPHGPDPSDKKP